MKVASYRRGQTIIVTRPLRRMPIEQWRTLRSPPWRWRAKLCLGVGILFTLGCIVVPLWLQSVPLLIGAYLLGLPVGYVLIRWPLEWNRKWADRFDHYAEAFARETLRAMRRELTDSECGCE